MITLSKSPTRWLLLLATALLVGCGDGLVDVSGTVTVEGAPVEEGRISFIPEAGGEVQGARIENGNFTAQVAEGTHRVEISGSKQVGSEKPPFADESTPEVPVMENMVPAKYQKQSELTANITAEMEPLNFKLDAN